MTTDSSGRSQPRLRTGSLRLRLILSALSVVTALLVVVVIATSVILSQQLRSSAQNGLAGRAATAQQLLDRGAEPAEIVAESQGDGTTAQLVSPEGRVYGNLTLGPRSSNPQSPDPQSPNPQRPTPPGSSVPPGTVSAAPVPPAPPGREVTDRQALTTVLSDGSAFTVAVDSSAISRIQQQLLTILVPVVLVAVAIAAALLTVAVSRSLRPLRTMTEVAGSITRGNRGARLNPDRETTELGRTAAAFDEMLDALDDAQVRERAQSDRTRRFFDDAAHDLRTPVAGVVAAAETLLRAGTDADRDTRERLQLLMVREARHAARLIDDLVSVARTDLAADLAPTDLLDLIEADADRVRLLAPHLTVKVVGSSIRASVDRARIAQLLSNLTDNARRHGNPDGRVVLTLDRYDGGARIAVQDDGDGIAEADRERIFDRLVRLDSSRTGSSGSGLGLAIARSIARAHGGDLVCTDNESGPGARFVLTLPDAPSRPSGAEAL